MNIFFIDPSPERSARMMVDAHIVKMPLETAQMICTAGHILGINPAFIPYKPTHANHPCVRWILESKANVTWLQRHYTSLMTEFMKRFGHPHHGLEAHHPKLASLFDNVKRRIDHDTDSVTTPALAMPEWYKVFYEDGREINYVWSYRNYYFNEKLKICMGKSTDPFRRSPMAAGTLPPYAQSLNSDPLSALDLLIEGLAPRQVRMDGYRVRARGVGVDIKTINVSQSGKRSVISWALADGTQVERAVLEGRQVLERQITPHLPF